MESLNLRDVPMKKLILLSTLLISANIQAYELKSYKAVEQAAIKGEAITVVADFNKCTPSIPITAVHSPETIMVVDNAVKFSTVEFTMNNPQHSTRPVDEYLTYSLKGKQFTFTTQLIDAVNKAPLGDVVTLFCELNEGVKYYLQ